MEEWSFSWQASGSFEQIPTPENGDAAPFGKFWWNNGKFENGFYKPKAPTCDCDQDNYIQEPRYYTLHNIEDYDPIGRVYYMTVTVPNVRKVVRDRDDPSYIIIDIEVDITINLAFNSENFRAFTYWDSKQRWTSQAGLVAVNGGHYGPPYPNEPPKIGEAMGTMELDNGRTSPPCGSPFGTYSGSGNDSATLGSAGDDVNYNQQHSVSGSFTVGGSGGVDECTKAPRIDVENIDIALKGSDGDDKRLTADEWELIVFNN